MASAKEIWSFVLRDARELRRRLARRLTTGAGALLGVSGIGAALSLAGGPLVDLAHSVGVGALVGSLGLLAVAGLARFIGVPRGGGHVRAERDGEQTTLVVELGGEERMRVPMTEVESGRVLPPLYVGAPARVRITRRDGDELLLVVDRFEEGLELLSALGVDDRRVSVRARQHGGFALSVFAAMFLTIPALFPIAFLIVGLGSAWPVVLGPLTWGLLIAFMVRVVSPGALEVGADGVSWGRRSKRRFVSFADIASVELGAEAIVLNETGGERWTIPLGPVGPNTIEMMARRIEALVARAKAGRSTEPLELLRRGGRTEEEWMADLRALLDAEDYRRPTVPRARVVETLEDDLADADERLGAALALMQDEGPSVAPRIRVVAEKSANPELADALEEVASGRRTTPKRRA